MGIIDGGQGAGGAEGGAGSGGASGSGGSAAPGGAGASGAGGSGGASGAQSSWRDALPDDIKGNPVFANFSDVGNLAKSYLHAQQAIGKKGIIPPGENAGEEEMKAFHKAIGVPDLDKYEIKGPKDAKLDEALLGKFKEIAHKSGVLPKQAEALLSWYETSQREAQSAQAIAKKEATETALKALKSEWGEGFEKNVLSAQNMAKEFGPEFVARLTELGVADDAVLAKALASGAKKFLTEDKLRGDGSGKFGQTPDEIQAELASMQADHTGPYMNKNHPGHEAAIRRSEFLYQKLYPTKTG